LLLGAKAQDTQQIVYVTQQQESRQSKTQQSEQDETTRKQEQLLRLQRMEQQVHASIDKALKQALEKALRAVCNELEACQGAVYLADEAEGKRFIELQAGYAYYQPESQRLIYEFGEGLAGQVAKEGQLINLTSVPDNYITVLSGLGKASPNHLIIAPIIDESDPTIHTVRGVIEIASFKVFSTYEEELVRKAASALGKFIHEHTTSPTTA
jgi:signal transduction protein with GAF and PtsI domain